MTAQAVPGRGRDARGEDVLPVPGASRAPGAARPRTVLFVERTIGFGGSTVGLGQIVARLDRRRFRPVVVVGHASQRDYLVAHGCAAEDVRIVPVRPTRIPPARSGPLPVRAAWRVADSARGIVGDWLRDLPWIREVTGFARSRGVELVHLNNSVSVNRAGIVVARRLRVPCVVKQRGFEWRSWGVRRLMRRVAWFLPDSAAVAGDLASLGAPRDRIRVTHCAVDPEPEPDEDDGARIREELGVPARCWTFGIVGQLLEWKGQDVFLRAAADVFRSVPDARALVVGGTPDGAESPYARRLRELSAELGIADRVVFTGHRTDVPRVFRALDVVVHASVAAEPFGTVVAEALAAGRPVVASEGGGPSEYVVEGRTGLLTRPGDVEGLARAIRRLLLDRGRAMAMAEAGRATVLRRFGVERHVAVTEQVYEEALAGPSA